MANVAIFKSGQTPQYLESVNTPDYSKDVDVLVNPDVSALDGVPLKYWKRVLNTVVEMNQTEKDALDAADLQAKKDDITTISREMEVLLKVGNENWATGKTVTEQDLIDETKSLIT